MTECLTPLPASAPHQIQDHLFIKCPLASVEPEVALSLIRQLYSPEERFAQVFYRYWAETLKEPETVAAEKTRAELQAHIQALSGQLNDPSFQTYGPVIEETYRPVGLYALRPLAEHKNGAKLVETIEQVGLKETYTGDLAMVHAFSTLEAFRNLVVLRYAFALMASDAWTQGFQHIFFFISDQRLIPLYQRFGLVFPPELPFPDPRYQVGSYSYTPKNMKLLQQALHEMNLPPIPIPSPVFTES